MEFEISVIIPVYNVEKTLKRCVESVLEQTFKNYEIILVDDGSPDNSGKICDEYAEKYDFIRVIHKENEGLGPTRNRGVREAKGRYIYHCDSDDWIKKDTLEAAYNNAIENDSDVVIFGYSLYTEKDNVMSKYSEVNVEKCVCRNKEKILDFFLYNIDNYFVVQSACNRLIKKQFLIDNDIWFKPFRRCQDIAFSYDLFDKIGILSTLDKAYYEYIIEPNVYKGRNFDEMIDIYLSVYDVVKERLNGWGRFEGDVKVRTTSMYCAHIANYLSFYIFRKAGEDKTGLLKRILANDRVFALFNEIEENKIKSRFIRLVRKAIVKKNVFFLYFILRCHNKKINSK